uniref:Retrotransposon gag domain-containing protein n=1 Tax=Tanacetum cinerariifolium TaxID=118510 RepID=A0A6L2KXK6_TANCI|nr:hypothetical protein [Tanacetum cinerariifolium]
MPTLELASAVPLPQWNRLCCRWNRPSADKVTDMSKVDKIEAKRTKPGTGMKRVQEIEAEGKFILNPILLILLPKRIPKTITPLIHTNFTVVSPLQDPESLIRRRNLGEPSSLFDFEEVMNNNHNQESPPQNNNGPPPMATNFGLRHHMIQQVQNTYQFHGLPGDDANRHIDKFLKITQHMKQNGVSDDALHLSLFPYSLTHHAIAWYDRLPRNSIHSFDDMMRKFFSKYFPPFMVTKLRNEILKFGQKPHESLFEAWEHYKLSIDHHRDTINAAPGGTFMQNTPGECYELIENMIAHHNHWDTSAIRDETSRNISSTSTTETIDGYTQETAYATTGNYNSRGNSYQPQGDCNLLSYRSNNYLRPPGFNQTNVKNQYNQNQNQNQNQRRRNNFNQAPTYQAPTHHPQVVTQSDFQAYMKENDFVMKNMQTRMTSLTNLNIELKNMFGQFMKMNTASSLGSGSLPSNTVPNPREDLKAITTRSGVNLAGPSVSPPPPSKEVDQEPETITDQMPEVTKDMVQPSTKNIQPPVAQTQVPIDEPIVAPKPKPNIPYPLRITKQKSGCKHQLDASFDLEKAFFARAYFYENDSEACGPIDDSTSRHCRRLVSDMSKVDKNKANRTKPSTGSERARKTKSRRHTHLSQTNLSPLNGPDQGLKMDDYKFVRDQGSEWKLKDAPQSPHITIHRDKDHTK